MTTDEQIERIKFLESNIALSIKLISVETESIGYRKQSIYDHQCRIEDMQKELELLQAQQKPKYTAKDFPCLDYNSGDMTITYNDRNYEYLIRSDLKRVAKYAQASKNYIDNRVDIVECKLSDIKKGDYFARADIVPQIQIENYQYCTNAIDNAVYYDYGYEGYIKKLGYVIRDFKDNDFVKFIQKDK